MNIKEIKEMINLMNENDLTEFEVEKDGLKVRLKKGLGGGIERTIERLEVKPGAVARHDEAGQPALVPAQPPKKTAEIKSPMVGTFYRTPSPEAPPFVKEGDTIEVGQVVCIIEAMKLMNEIKSEVKGRLAAILVENAQPVEFGQPLFIVEQ